MTIEFTKKELDYLAVKIAEILANRCDTSVIMGNSTTDAPVRSLGISVRLYNILDTIGILDWTPREIAYYTANEWKRFRNMGRKSFQELEDIIRKAGLTFGKNYFRRDGDYRCIIERPTERP